MQLAATYLEALPDTRRGFCVSSGCGPLAGCRAHIPEKAGSIPATATISLSRATWCALPQSCGAFYIK